MENMNYMNLSNAQIALILAEKAAPVINQGAKRVSDIIERANILLEWLNNNENPSSPNYTLPKL